MPRGDGTGPSGLGPKSGKRFGWCGNYFFPSGRFGRRKAGFFGVLIPAAGAVIRDVMNPHGMIRSVSRVLLSGRKERGKKEPVNTDYVVIEESREDQEKNISKKDS